MILVQVGAIKIVGENTVIPEAGTPFACDEGKSPGNEVENDGSGWFLLI